MTKTTKQKSESVFDHLRVLEFSDGEGNMAIVEASETPSSTSLVCYSPMALCSLATLCSLLVTRLRNFNN